MQRTCATRLAYGLLGGWLALGCDSAEIPECELVMVTDEGTAPWTTEPRPVTLEVVQELSDTARTRTSFKQLQVPASDSDQPVFTIGRGADAVFEVIASDAAGTPVVRGRSWYLDPPSLAGYILPIFVARVGIFSRPPGGFPIEQGDAPLVESLGGRFAVSLGNVENGSMRLDGYDLGLWGTEDSSWTSWIACPAGDCQPKSLAVAGGSLAVIVGDDWARLKDFLSNSVLHELSPPTGLAFSDVAGGATIHDPAGNAYIVGATRAENPTKGVLRMGADGSVTAVLLAEARAGAAATWITGRGLVVIGGSATGAGAELLTDGTAAFVALPFAADTTTGAGIVGLDSSTVLRVGGLDATGAHAPSVRLSLACGADCQLEPAGDPIALTRAQGYLLGTNDTFWVGTSDQGLTAAWRVIESAAAEVGPFDGRQPRIGASPLRLDTGQIALMGGHFADGSATLALDLYQP